MLPASTVELTIEDLLARAKVNATIGDRNDHLAAYDLSLQVEVVRTFGSPETSESVYLLTQDVCFRGFNSFTLLAEGGVSNQGDIVMHIESKPNSCT